MPTEEEERGDGRRGRVGRAAFRPCCLGQLVTFALRSCPLDLVPPMAAPAHRGQQQQEDVQQLRQDLRAWGGHGGHVCLAVMLQAAGLQSLS